MSDSKSLHKSEWVFFISICVLLAAVVCIAKMSSFRNLKRLQNWETEKPVQEIWIEITGHVKRPGKYKLARGTKLGRMIDKAHPQPFADLSQFDLNSIPKESQSLEIRKLPFIRIWVAGCVKENLGLEVKPGFRICDLKGKVELTPDADRAFLRKKRRLQDGEVVEIPSVASHCRQVGCNLVFQGSCEGPERF